MRDERNLQHLDTCARRANARPVSATRIVANISVPDLSTPSVVRWRILDQSRQVAVFERTNPDARRLCTGLSTDSLDNDARDAGRHEMQRAHRSRIGCA